MSTAVRNSVFSFVGTLIVQHSLPNWSHRFNLQLVQLLEGFGSSSLVTIPLCYNCGFIYTYACESSIGVCSWGCLGVLGSAPVRTRLGHGAAAWITGALGAPGTQGSQQQGQQEIRCQLQIGTCQKQCQWLNSKVICHLPLWRLNLVLMQLLTFNMSWGNSGWNEALWAPGNLEEQVFR